MQLMIEGEILNKVKKLKMRRHLFLAHMSINCTYHIYNKRTFSYILNSYKKLK